MRRVRRARLAKVKNPDGHFVTEDKIQTQFHTPFSDVINPPSLIADSILEMSAL